MKVVRVGLLLLMFSGCSLFEDVNTIVYRDGDQDMSDLDMETDALVDMPDLQPDAPDAPVDMESDVEPDAPVDMEPDSPPDMEPDAPVDMPPDMPVSCLVSGCTEPEFCDTVTEMCGPCGPNAPCTNGRDCQAGMCVCPTDQNYCNSQCVPESPTACGATCQICPGGFDANATCDNGVCGLECQTSTDVIYGAGCASQGGTCPSASQPLAGTCNIIYQTGCNVDQVCTFTLRNAPGTCSSNLDCLAGQTCNTGLSRCVYFETGCSNGTNTIIPLGEPCLGSNDRCVPGGLCSSGICKQMCDALSGIGCAPTQFCKPLQAGSGAGVCESQC